MTSRASPVRPTHGSHSRTRARDVDDSPRHAGDVGDVPIPGPLAISVAQVDAMSGGRIELGLGAGWYEEEHRAYGIPFPPSESASTARGVARDHHRTVADAGGTDVHSRGQALPDHRLARPAQAGAIAASADRDGGMGKKRTPRDGPLRRRVQPALGRSTTRRAVRASREACKAIGPRPRCASSTPTRWFCAADATTRKSPAAPPHRP